MKRFAVIGALLGALVLGAASTSQAYYVYPRPVARTVARVVLPPYRPGVIVPRVYGPIYGPRVYYGYGPRFYGAPYYRAWGPGWYGPAIGIGIY
ncbi:MAG TPA: hypothetical protein VFI31_08785 [Pirellulales bacterium]|nr:hypothetical protein [Pirellulales bacterium]